MVHLKIQHILIFILILFAFYLRLDLMTRPLWIDEAKFMTELVHNQNHEWREIIPYFIAIWTDPQSEFTIRLPFVLFGILSIPAVWLVIKDKRKTWILMAILALMPLYVYWSAMARPYIVALFFVILGWRWPVFYIPALITSPYALAGLNFWQVRERWIWYVILIPCGIFFYYYQDLSSLNHFNVEFLYNAKRLWIIPAFSLALHLADFDLEKLQGLLRDHQQLEGDRM